MFVTRPIGYFIFHTVYLQDYMSDLKAGIRKSKGMEVCERLSSVEKWLANGDRISSQKQDAIILGSREKTEQQIEALQVRKQI